MAQPVRIISMNSIMDHALAIANPTELPSGYGPLYRVLQGTIISVLGYRVDRPARKITLVIGALSGLHLVWTLVSPAILQRITNSFEVPFSDESATDIAEWLKNNGSGSADQHVRLQDHGEGRDKLSVALNEERIVGETALTSGWFFFESRPLIFKIINSPSPASSSLHASERQERRSIQIRSFGTSGRLLARFLKEVRSESKDFVDKVMVYGVVPEGRRVNFEGRHVPKRPLNTIDLDEAIKADLLDYIATFRTDAAEYARRGIPWRRGYLFHGPPGTGKSSTARALASHVDAGLWQIDLGKVPDDASLAQLFQNPFSGDILLLEDIDAAGIVREETMRSKSKKGKGKDGGAGNVTLQGLINALDSSLGLAEGVIVIMTTNNPEGLDPALLRDGRMDKKVELGYVTHEVAVSIFKRMFDRNIDPKTLETLAENFANKLPDRKLTPAEVQGFCLRSKTPEAAILKAESWAASVVAARKAGKNIVELGYKPTTARNESDDGSDDESDDKSDDDAIDLSDDGLEGGEEDASSDDDDFFIRRFDRKGRPLILC
ncbi:P-loop containing nucleoside triphosphate hydrolase protein [Dendryphion nanum]|uniref:P-loop containing nucleoside triphosphate hydrolase protein n=1 Tax=Dendryphion nanum TaxID=256645 RepID=A0A9P9DTX3_9PLEO|nr:P-loop containing nucleoside triphosphate hydrolase protein [Dendryphion nanum]